MPTETDRRKKRLVRIAGRVQQSWKLERVEGIEPSTKAWEAFVLPLNYTRSKRLTLYQMRVRI